MAANLKARYEEIEAGKRKRQIQVMDPSEAAKRRPQKRTGAPH